MKNISVSEAIKRLAAYAVKEGLIEPVDEVYARNRLMEQLAVDALDGDAAQSAEKKPETLAEILSVLCDYAVEKGLIEHDSVVYRDLFDTRLMGVLTPPPSVVISKFSALRAVAPERATEEYYRFSKATNYIRTDRIAKDLKWKTDSVYGPIDITINLSKPEKDPKAIAAAKLLPQHGYPKCLLCRENEGYAGRLDSPARQNHRMIPLTLCGREWFLQYSPYVYYNEHCIVLSKDHVPMKIDRRTFSTLLEFVDAFPHYFIGSNADLPIVGGSILSHDHMQGGRYRFAMEAAEDALPLVFDGAPDVRASIVKWPLSVIRLNADQKEPLCALAERILGVWRTYTDEAAFVFAQTDGEPHNTVTPIARRRNGAFELDLVLRCNITTERHPLGVFHPHAEKHNIKKENIGLIEVMGLAVLPARLKEEMRLMKQAILDGVDFRTVEAIEKHAAWFEAFRGNYRFSEENTEDILKNEIGKTFVGVLEDAGIYKRTPEGTAAFLRFVAAAGGRVR